MNDIKTRLVVGDWVQRDFLGMGIYEVHSIDDFHIQLKVLKLFGQGTKYRGHITCYHHGSDDNGDRIPINHGEWLHYEIKKPLTVINLRAIKLLKAASKEYAILESQRLADRALIDAELRMQLSHVKDRNTLKSGFNAYWHKGFDDAAKVITTGMSDEQILHSIDKLKQMKEMYEESKASVRMKFS